MLLLRVLLIGFGCFGPLTLNRVVFSCVSTALSTLLSSPPHTATNPDSHSPALVACFADVSDMAKSRKFYEVNRGSGVFLHFFMFFPRACLTFSPLDYVLLLNCFRPDPFA